MEEEETHHDSNEKIIIKRGWPVHESKSRPGWKYYYDTEAKEAKWLPCNTQVENVEFYDRSKQNQSALNSGHYPEPKNSPPREIIGKSNRSARIYNKQIINNKFPSQNYNIPVSGADQNLYNPFNYVPVNVPPVCTNNNEQWSIPSPTPLIVAPIIKQPQLLVDTTHVVIPVGYQNFPHNIFNPAMNSASGSNVIHENVQRFQHKHHISNRFGDVPNFRNRKFYHTIHRDLRRKLYNKNLMGCGPHFNRNMNRENLVFNMEDNCTDVADHCWQETEEFLDKSQRLDLMALKSLASPHMNLEKWYIVADANVIQENYKFMNNLLDSDDCCRIMVPQSVLMELLTAAQKPQHINARRIFRFISEEINHDRKWIGDHFSNESNILGIFDVCLKLSAEKYFVVLVSDDQKYLEYKNTTAIQIFSIQEIKTLLNHRSNNEISNKTLPAEKFIKISVDNVNKVINNEQQNNIHVFSSDLNVYNFENQLPKICDVDSRANNDKGNDNVTSNDTETQLTNAETQPTNAQMQHTNAEIQNTYAEIQPANAFESNETGLNYCKGDDNIGYSNNTCQVNKASNNVSKSRTINLKQNAGTQKQLNSNKKRWTCKKIVSCAKNNALSNSSMSSFNTIMEQKTTELYKDIVGTENVMTSTDNEDNSNSCALHNNEKSNNNETQTNSKPTNEDKPESEDMVKMQHVSVSESEHDLKIMFQITDKTMEEHLIIRCDEWVSRFIQVMEEALSQALHQKPKFISKKFPPPWNLQEATQCIIKKFSDCFYVVDAANNLSIIIQKTIYSTGKMAANIEPALFMKIYSYGVYLVKSLKEVCNNCEDLLAAEELLKKLLNDIQNQSIDSGNDSFSDILHDPPPMVDKESSDDDTENYVGKSKGGNEVIMNENQEKALSDNNENNSNEPVHQLESSFFETLQLRKLDCIPSTPAEDVPQQGQECEVSHDDNDPKVINEPVVIRKFNAFPEFENRLKNMFNPLTQPAICDDKEEQDVSKSSDDEHSNHYFNKEDQEISESSDDDEYDYRYGNKEDTCKENESEPVADKAEDNIKKFKCFIKLFVDEIKAAFVEVQMLCKKDFFGSVHSQHVYKNALKIHSHVEMLTKSLESILSREEGDSFEGIRKLLKVAEFDIPYEPKLASEYKKMVTMSLDVANGCLHYLNRVITLHKDTLA